NTIKEVTGEEISEADILTASSSEVFETQSLERTLTNATRKLSEDDRITILECLANIIRSDAHVRHHELEFFDHVATALRASPSEIAGLAISSK
ncbi:MAG: TerB family tellurite resistance protein, partial [Gammaproteobacteria bacterium]|nr:TerB family tellurite resistance protein [Gammaproteobacteria bacterium]